MKLLSPKANAKIKGGRAKCVQTKVIGIPPD